MSKAKTFTLGGKPLPADIHTVWTEDSGQSLAVGDGITLYDFAFRDIRFAGRLEQGGGHAQVRLAGDLGPMPYSAESPSARLGIARIVEAANAHLGDGTFRISQGRILLGNDLEIPAPVDATRLVTAMVRFLVPALPYLELIAIYMRPPLTPAKPGESQLRPEWRRK
jgi:hypothetical protein